MSPSPERRALSAVERGLSGLDHVATWAARVGGLAIGCSAIFIAIDVILRKSAGITLGAMDEVTGYIFIVATSWSFSYTLIRRAHIRIDTLYVWLPRPVQVALDFVCMVVLAAFSGTLLWYAWLTVADTIRMGSVASTPLRTPLWLPQVPWLGGLVFFFVTVAILLLAIVWFVIRRRSDLVLKYGGAPSLNDEVEEVLDEAVEYKAPGAN